MEYNMTSAVICMLFVHSLHVVRLTDLTDSTIIELVGIIVQDGDVQRLLLTCSSCTIPKGNNAEFLINNSSADSITFNDETGKCTHLHGECIASECNCSSSGNSFDRFFLLQRPLNISIYFSCDMRFEDKDKSVVFTKISTVSFNGKEFRKIGTRTDIIKTTDDYNRSKDKDIDKVEVIIAAISVFTLVTIILAVGVYSHRKERKLKRPTINDVDPKLADIKEKTLQLNLVKAIQFPSSDTMGAISQVKHIRCPNDDSNRRSTGMEPYMKSETNDQNEDVTSIEDGHCSSLITRHDKGSAFTISFKKREIGSDDDDDSDASLDYVSLFEQRYQG